MKQSLELGVSQQLTMTPQLQQAIRLLQLSTLELQAEITETLEVNPLLELEEEGSDGMEEGNDTELSTPGADEPLNGAEPGHEGQQDAESEPDMDFTGNEDIPTELEVDTSWEDTFIESTPELPRDSSRDAETQEFANDSNAPESLNEYLLGQLGVTPLSDRDRRIGEALINYVDESGYLTTDLEEIRVAVDEDPESPVEIEDIEPVLHLIQRFDPPGVAARDLRECLLLQLEQRERSPAVKNATSLVTSHLKLLASHDQRKLLRQSGLDEAALRAAVEVIRTLDPRPGASISPLRPEYIVPDVLVSRKDGNWLVELNPEIIPRLRINHFYAGMIKKRDNSADNNYLKNQLNEARWFINSVKSRHATLLNVARCIVERQIDFFNYGPQAMKPMVLHYIAEELGMHESTISRVTSKKYMLTPKAIYELKFFFSSHVSTADGGMASATAIRSHVKELIEAEGEKPLSDNKIAALLKDKGFHVARRTVAKYRESMNIPPSNERKRSAFLT